MVVSFPAERSKTPLDGRLLLLLSTNGNAEPRFQVNDGAATQLVFGGPPECPERPFCLKGLGDVYGLVFRVFGEHRDITS